MGEISMIRRLSPGRLVAATHNKGKVAELKDLFEPLGFEVVSAIELDLPEPEETEATFAGNAILKARAAAEATDAPALSDDSGLSVTALGGAPGIYSARWAGEPRDFGRAMQRVHDELGETADRTARFVSVIALARPDGTLSQYRGEVTGSIVWPPRGTGGFGYDPVFCPQGESRTFGEMAPEEKRALSHRARALAAMIAAEFGS